MEKQKLPQEPRRPLEDIVSRDDIAVKSGIAKTCPACSEDFKEGDLKQHGHYSQRTGDGYVKVPADFHAGECYEMMSQPRVDPVAHSVRQKETIDHGEVNREFRFMLRFFAASLLAVPVSVGLAIWGEGYRREKARSITGDPTAVEAWEVKDTSGATRLYRTREPFVVEEVTRRMSLSPSPRGIPRDYVSRILESLDRNDDLLIERREFESYLGERSQFTSPQ